MTEHEIVERITRTFPDGVALHDVRAAIQAAWIANEDSVAIEIAQRYDLYRKICMRCATWETDWTLCVTCARYEVWQLQGTPIRRDRVHAFQAQWTRDNPNDGLRDDSIVGLATMVRGWRPYHTYGVV